MPNKPLVSAIDWPGIRAATVALGVREAARRAAASLMEPDKGRLIQRIMKRCSREHWLQVSVGPAQRIVQAPTTSADCPQPLSGAQAIQASLEDDKQRSVSAITRAVRRKAEHIAELEPGKIKALELSHLATAHSKLHAGGEEAARVVVPVQINIG